MRRICVFTGTRAEYGLLCPLLRRIDDDPDTSLQLLVSGTHLSPEFGMTVSEIIADGFEIHESVDMVLSADTPVAITKSMGLGLIGFGDALRRLNPDMFVVLGDRYEVLAAVIAALIAQVPIAHIHGGEVTLGAVDEAIRHSVSKMSDLHFTATAEYRRRVIQLGEPPSQVFNVGALGVENLSTNTLLTRSALSAALDWDLSGAFLLSTFHPTTADPGSASAHTDALLSAFESILKIRPEMRLLVTHANADVEGRLINSKLTEFGARHPERVRTVASLGLLRYLSAMRHCAAVVGNSSSGIIEAPSLGVPSVDIGDRQKGRVRASSVLHARPSADGILAAIQQVLRPDNRAAASRTDNPYAGTDTSLSILRELKEAVLPPAKTFVDLPFDLETLPKP